MATANHSDLWVQRIMADKSKSKSDRDLLCNLAVSMRLNQFVPFWPNNLQIAALMSTEREILLGGEARSGKSSAAMIKALTCITVPGYKATFFRETERELMAEGGLIDVLNSWMRDLGFLGTEAVWRNDIRTMQFPQWNSAIEFGYLASPGDEIRFRGFERQLFDFEEITAYKFKFDQEDGGVPWNPYQFLARSQSKPPGMPVEVQTFATTNPGGASEGWVLRYFLPPPPIGIRKDIPGSRVYMIWQPPSGLFGGRLYLHGVWRENPGIDHMTYAQSAALADETTRAQQFEGQWGVVTKGNVFDTRKLRRVEYAPPEFMQMVRAWDKAGTQLGDGPRSAGVLLARIAQGSARGMYGPLSRNKLAMDNVEYVIVHGVAGRWSSDQREDNIDTIATGGYIYLDDGRNIWYDGDGSTVPVLHEQEPGSGGKQSAEITTNRLIRKGFMVSHERVTGDKETRARQLATAVNNGFVAIVDDDSWGIDDYMREFARFPNGVIDYVDATSLGYNRLASISPTPPPTFTQARQRAQGFLAE